MPQLTPHFHSSEFDCHDGTPLPERAYVRYRHLCRKLLEPMRSEWGRCHVISGFRSFKHNLEVGGAPRSMHLLVRGRLQQQIAHCFDVAPIVGGQPDRNRKSTLPFYHLGHTLAPSSRVDHILNMRNIQPIPSQRFAIDLNPEFRYSR